MTEPDAERENAWEPALGWFGRSRLGRWVWDVVVPIPIICLSMALASAFIPGNFRHDPRSFYAWTLVPVLLGLAAPGLTHHRWFGVVSSALVTTAIGGGLILGHGGCDFSNGGYPMGYWPAGLVCGVAGAAATVVGYRLGQWWPVRMLRREPAGTTNDDDRADA